MCRAIAHAEISPDAAGDAVRERDNAEFGRRLMADAASSSVEQ